MKLTVDLSCRDDNYTKKYRVTLLDSNIIHDDSVQLPHCPGNYIQFVAEYSPVYAFHSKDLVNTRLQYPTINGIRGNNVIFCKLNWWQRQKLAIITRESWIHKNPVATVALIVNILAGIINLVVGFINLTH